MIDLTNYMICQTVEEIVSLPLQLINFLSIFNQFFNVHWHWVSFKIYQSGYVILNIEKNKF